MTENRRQARTKTRRARASFQVSRSKKLRATEVFDSYWRFACERQIIFLKRVAGHPPPWTEDTVLQSFRFTNVYRASDRVSQFLIRQVIYEGEQSEEEVFFRTVLFKLFNKVDTWRTLQERLGALTWRYTFVKRKDWSISALRGRSSWR